LIAVDLNKSSGATEFTINNVQRLRDLSYFPPQKMSLIPNSKLGRVTVDKSGITISTGTNSKSISTIISSLNLENIPVQIKENGQKTKVKGNNLPSSIVPHPSSFNVIVVDDLTKTTFTEGSYAVWDVPNGEYLIQWQFKTGETVESIKADSIYFYNGQQLQLLGNIQLERSPNNEELIEVRNGKLGIIVLDEKDKSGTTQIKITNIEQTKSEAELPPLNDDESTNNSDGNNNENGENLETIINPVNQEINFTFGGNITAYRSILNLDENKELTLTLDKPLIIEISQNNSVIYSQQYINELTVTLLAGEYQLNLFTESSIEEDYQLILNTVSRE
jgi:hypothetical protein